jgi:hypothetical protein
MNECPEIDLLMSGPPVSGELGTHLANCQACSAVIALANVREEREAGRDDECVRAEVQTALWHLGEIEDEAHAELIAHLESCSRCNEAAVRLRSLPTFRDESTQIRTLVGAVPIEMPPERSPASSRDWRSIAMIAIPAAAIAIFLISLVGAQVVRTSARSEPIESLSSGAGSATRARARSATGPSISVTPSVLDPLGPFAPRGSPKPSPSASDNSTATGQGDGFLTIVCDPFCTDVRVGDRSLGPSPIVRAELPPGTHDVTLVRDALKKHLHVTIIGDQTTARRVKMDGSPDKSALMDPWATSNGVQDPFVTIKPGSVTVLCNPFCDSVSADGKNLGPSPIVRAPLAPGVHRLSFKRGAMTKHSSVVIESDKNAALRIDMEAPAKLADPGY